MQACTPMPIPAFEPQTRKAPRETPREAPREHTRHAATTRPRRSPAVPVDAGDPSRAKAWAANTPNTHKTRIDRRMDHAIRKLSLGALGAAIGPWVGLR
jgi:hypothetical protein